MQRRACSAVRACSAHDACELRTMLTLRFAKSATALWQRLRCPCPPPRSEDVLPLTERRETSSLRHESYALQEGPIESFVPERALWSLQGGRARWRQRQERRSRGDGTFEGPRRRTLKSPPCPWPRPNGAGPAQRERERRLPGCRATSRSAARREWRASHSHLPEPFRAQTAPPGGSEPGSV